MERVEFCCHTKMSEMQGLNTIEEYVEEAKERGYKAIAISDVNSLQGYMNAHSCKDLLLDDEFKIIYGSELYFKYLNNKYRINVYVKEQVGLKNLYKLVSIAYENAESNEPLLNKEELIKYREGLLYASIGKNGEVYQNIDKESIKDIINFYDFIGIVPYDSKETNKKIDELCHELGKILIASSDCNFVKEPGFYANEVLNIYKDSSNIEEGNERYFRTSEELMADFDYLDDAKEIVVDNTIKVANLFDEIDITSKKGYWPKIENGKEKIKEKCFNAVHGIYGENLPEVVEERLNLELDSICKFGFEALYLICSELVEYSNKLGYKAGYRGGVGCSFVAFLLGITGVNPLDYNLPFEIFSGKKHDVLPNIDLNFSDRIRDKIIDYLKEKFGQNKVIWCGTVGTICTENMMDTIEKYIEEKGCDEKKDLIVEMLDGVKVKTGIHPGGVFILPENLDILDFCPTESEDGKEKTHFDYHSLTESGLLKINILSDKELSLIHDLEEQTKFDSNNIDLRDDKTLKFFEHIYEEKNTYGIIEIDEESSLEMFEIAEPKTFNDLVCLSALKHGAGTWYDNADKLIKEKGISLSETISNREDMYNYLIANGIDTNVAYDIVHFVKIGLFAKFGEIENIYVIDKWKEYKNIMKEHNIPEWYIDSAEKIRYLFPKSHAITYAINTFKIAWYKAHYPIELYKVCNKVEKGRLAEMIKNYTDGKIDSKEIKQIEVDADNNNYIVTTDNRLYKTKGGHDPKIIGEDVQKIYVLDLVNLYKISTENKILPIEEDKKWNNIDKYLNNNNTMYKKVETSETFIVALTEEGNVKLASSLFISNLGILPERFSNVEDIKIIRIDEEIEKPYVIKEGKLLPLFVED